MKVSKQIKIMLIVLAIVIVGFFGFGIWFSIQGVLGMSFLGFGLGCIGLGFFLLMGDGVFFYTHESQELRQPKEKIAMQSKKQVSINNSNKREKKTDVPLNVLDVTVLHNGLQLPAVLSIYHEYFTLVYDSVNLKQKYSDLSNVNRISQKLSFVCEKQTYQLMFESGLKARLLVDAYQKSLIERGV